MSSEEYSRYSLFPIQYPTLFELYEKQRDAFWVPKEVDLEEDVKEWREKLTPEDQHFLTYTLSFFAQADGIVLRNLNVNFSVDIDIPEAILFYGVQAGIEAIHWEVYGRLIEAFITDPHKKADAFNAIESYPCIKKKAEWLLKWMHPDRPHLERLVAFACGEGIGFSSAFASIFYYKKRGLMPGLCHSNKMIARDEGLHRDFGCELFKILRKRSPNAITDETVQQIVRECVNVEESFVRDSLNVELIGINNESMLQYVKLVADHLLTTLNVPKIYNVENPFDWMSMISLSSKQNFFEGRVADYKKPKSDMTFATDDDF